MPAWSRIGSRPVWAATVLPRKGLRTYWGSSGQSGAVPVQVWVDGQGAVTRVAFAPYLDDQANQDLTPPAARREAPDPHPPSGLLLPIRLNLHVAAAAGPAVGQKTSSTDKP